MATTIMTIINDTSDSSEFPTTIKPMLVTLMDRPFNNKERVFEVIPIISYHISLFDDDSYDC